MKKYVVPSIIIPVVLLVALWCMMTLLGRTSSHIDKPPETISITIRIPQPGRWGYLGHRALLEAYEIESLGRRWNQGEYWVGKYIEAMIMQSDTTLKDFRLKKGQKIEFAEEVR